MNENNKIKIRNPYSPLSLIADMSVIFGFLVIMGFKIENPAAIGMVVAFVVIMQVVSLVPGMRRKFKKSRA